MFLVSSLLEPHSQSSLAILHSTFSHKAIGSLGCYNADARHSTAAIGKMHLRHHHLKERGITMVVGTWLNIRRSKVIWLRSELDENFPSLSLGGVDTVERSGRNVISLTPLYPRLVGQSLWLYFSLLAPLIEPPH